MPRKTLKFTLFNQLLIGFNCYIGVEEARDFVEDIYIVLTSNLVEYHVPYTDNCRKNQ